jgi:predicted transcriptional regulator
MNLKKITMSTENKDVNVSFKTTRKLKDRVDAIAKVTRRSISFIIEESLIEYLDRNEWEIEEILEGLEDIKAGRVTPIEEVIAEWEGKLESCHV